jgi:hypothetical protein
MLSLTYIFIESRNDLKQFTAKTAVIRFDSRRITPWINHSMWEINMVAKKLICTRLRSSNISVFPQNYDSLK